MSNVIELSNTDVPAASWSRIFSSNDPFVWPFRAGIESCLVFYPTDGYFLTREQYIAVISALKKIGDQGFFLSIVESEGLSFLGRLDRPWGHWWCDNPSYEEYCKMDLPLENGLYSKEGLWGILISHEDHALIGGTENFIATLAEGYLGWAEDLESLREAWSDNLHSEWIKPIVDRITR